MKNKICTLLLTAALAGTLAIAGGCGSSASGTAGTAEAPAESEDAADEAVDEDTDVAEEEDVDSEDSEGDEEELDLEDLEVLDDEEEEPAPYDKEAESYFEANMASELLKNHKNILFNETMKNSSGEELYAYDMFVSPELRMIRYTNGDQEFSDNGTYSGFDSQLNMPYRYVFYDEESVQEQDDTYDEFVYFWPGEGAEEKSEEGNEVTFTCYIRDNSMLDMVFYDQEEEVEADSYIERKLVFNKDTKEFLRSSALYYHKDGTSVDIGSSTMTLDGEALTPDQELLDKLNNSDSHTLTLTLDPGTEDEKVLTCTVGKGCTFYPAVPDGYGFYLDKDKKEAADEQLWNESEKDLTLYGFYEEDLDGEEIEIDEDDLGDIEADGEEDADEPELTEEELQDLLENGDVQG